MDTYNKAQIVHVSQLQ